MKFSSRVEPGWLLAGICFLSVALSAAESPFLYGIHDHDPDPGEFLNHIKSGTGGTGGWVTATFAVGANPNDFGGANFTALANAGHTVICRINHGYFPDGTIPVASKYDDFATRCKNFVANSSGCNIWLIGNELNLAAEWPFDSSNNRFNFVSPQAYANCFRKAYNAIKSVRPDDKVLPQPSAPWGGPYGSGFQNIGGTDYPHDAQPLTWVQHQNQVLTAIAASGPVDGIALHIGSRGYHYADIHSTNKFGSVGLYASFYVYKDWVDYGIPPPLYSLPLYVTECNGLYYWKGGGPPGEDLTKHYEAGWMQEVFAEFNRYNQSAATNGRPIFRCVNFYRWCSFCDGWNVDGASNPYKAQILSDLDASVAQLYRWPTNVFATNPPAAPTELTATVGNGQVALNWNSVAFANTYKVKRATASGGPYSAIASNLTTTSYVNTSFTVGTPYFYRVTAVNALGESPDSNTASATPTNGLPDVIVTAISWTAASIGPGTNVVFRVTVKNQGAAATPGGTIIGVGFLVDGVQYSWSGGYSSALAAGSSVTLTADGGPGGLNYWTATAGAHTVTANVDDINRFAEGDEGNNLLNTNLMVYVAGYALNTGDGATGIFAADNFWSGSGNTFSVTDAIDTNGVAFAAPQPVYQTERWGDFSYTLPNLFPGGAYRVRLHFAEISPSVTTTNDRRFHVFINGAQVLTNFDIIAAANGKFRAVTSQFAASANGDGQIVVAVTRGAANEGKLSGVEAWPPPPNLSAIAVGTSVALSWLSHPGKIYRVQYKNDLSATPWSNLAGNVAGTGGVVTKTDSPGTTPKFYRILVLN